MMEKVDNKSLLKELIDIITKDKQKLHIKIKAEGFSLESTRFFEPDVKVNVLDELRDTMKYNLNFLET